MPITREKKEKIVQNIQECVSESPSVVFVNFHGLSVSESTDLRGKLKGEGCHYKVAKKTLVKRALAGAGLEGEQPDLEGELALAWGDDPVAPAREIHKFAKEFEGKLNILGGVFEGRYVGTDEVIALATIPPREVLYGQFVNVLNAPVSGFVSVLDNTIGSFVRALHEVAQSRS